MTAPRPKVLLVCRTYLPGYKAGGPIRTLSNMVDVLGDDIDFRIVTLDRDLNAPAPYPDIVPGEWTRVGKGHVLYLRREGVSLTSLQAIVAAERPDVLYLNSLMDTVFPARLLLLRRLRRIAVDRCVLAVRGQLNPGALDLRALPKRLYLAALKHGGLLDGLVWQASGTPEVDAIRAAIGTRLFAGTRSPIFIAPDLAHIALHDAAAWQPRVADAPLRIALLGRIAVMKNVDFAIAALARMRRNATLDIIGPIEDAAYWQSCKAAIAALPRGRGVVALGAIDPGTVPAALAQYDAMLLPSRGENFGHAIAEALGAGLPVVISNRTPWRDLAAHDVGWDLPLDDPGAFAARLDDLADLDPVSMRRKRETCARYAEKAVSDDAILAANRALFLPVIDTGPNPSGAES